MLHLHILLRKDEFVIRIDDRGDGGDELQAQPLLGKFQPVFGHADVQACGIDPEILQQRLGGLERDRPEVVMNPEVIVGPDVTIRNVGTEIIGHPPGGSAGKARIKIVLFGHRPTDELAVLVAEAGIVVTMLAREVERRVVAAVSCIQNIKRDLRVITFDLDVEVVRQRFLDAIQQRHRTTGDRIGAGDHIGAGLGGGRQGHKEKKRENSGTFHHAKKARLTALSQ